MKNILMFYGITQYNLLNIFVEYMAEAFRKIGINVDIVNSAEKEIIITEELYNKKYDLCLVFNGMLRELQEKINKHNNIKRFEFYVDRPYRKPKQKCAFR